MFWTFELGRRLTDLKNLVETQYVMVWISTLLLKIQHWIFILINGFMYVAYGINKRSHESVFMVRTF